MPVTARVQQSTGTPPANPTAQTGAPIPGTPASPSSLLDLLQRYPRFGKIDTAGKQYIETLTQQLKSAGLNIKMLVLNKFEMALVYNSNNEGIALIFHDTKQYTENFPTTDRAGEIHAQAGVYGITVVSAMVVTTADYARVNQMAFKLIQNLNPTHRGLAMQFEAAMFANVPLVIDGDLNTVRDYFAQRHPHAVLPRIDCGFVVSMLTPSKTVSLSLDEQRGMDSTPIAAVGAYTEFVMEPSGADPKFRPIVTLNVIDSDYPSLNLLGMLIPLAADVLVLRQRYLSAYSFEPGVMNLGNLVMDPATKKPVHVNSPGVRDQFVSKFCLPPIMAINVTDGMSRILGLDMLLSQESNDAVSSAIAKFLGVSLAKDAPMLRLGVCPEYSGIVRIGDQMFDSHVVDYCYLVGSGKPQGELSMFLNKSGDPKVRIGAISQMVNGTQVLYTTRQVALNGGFVSAIGPMLQRAGFQARYINMGSLYDSTIQAWLQPSAGEIQPGLNFAGGNAFTPFQNFLQPTFGNPGMFRQP